MDIDKLKEYNSEDLKAGFKTLNIKQQELIGLRDKYKEETGEYTEVYDTEINNLTKDLTAIRGEAFSRGITLMELYNS